ncbi:AMP-binding protein [Citricoccus sp. NR2]|uniref:AMP-binding protein n=1 Tax=Citricoccus sp. NR2 TaxID=3004095 RepID=UPI0022DD9A0F|nr:AMP-binding protein [Citricoccus sp. NR2]WBL19499.1 AMP-binding protein [Citricoccus sp. NR2]
MAATFDLDGWAEKAEAKASELRDVQTHLWPPHIPREVPGELNGRTFIEIFQANVESAPDRTAINFYGTEITYRQLDDWSDSFAGWLISIGATAGDRIGVFLPNCPQFIVLMLGTLKAGMVHVPINPMFKRGELEFESNDAGLSVLICADYLYELVEAAELNTVRARRFIDVSSLVPETPTVRVPTFLSRDFTGKDDDAWQELTQGEPISSGATDPEAIAALNYTGGTTGVPKGCMHTQANMVVAAHNCALAWGISGAESVSDEVVVAFTPIFWISGENNGILAPLYAGATIVLMARWDAPAVLEAIETFKVTAMSGVVESYLELLSLAGSPQRQLGSLRHLRAMSFTRKLSIDIRRQWEDATGGGSILRESSFGMTESHTSNTFTTGLEDNDFDLLNEPVFVGLPMPGTDFLIVDSKDRDLVDQGEVGEIVLRSPSNFLGYWQKSKETEQTLVDGWIFTGDIGKLSANGTLHYLGRQKEMLKVNGMSVFPSEVEVLMGRHPEVKAVAVVGAQDESTGQSVHAFVEMKPESTVDAEALETWAKEHMAVYKVPSVHLMSEMPRTATGKILKKDLPDVSTTGGL